MFQAFFCLSLTQLLPGFGTKFMLRFFVKRIKCSEFVKKEGFMYNIYMFVPVAAGVTIDSSVLVVVYIFLVTSSSSFCNNYSTNSPENEHKLILTVPGDIITVSAGKVHDHWV